MASTVLILGAAGRIGQALAAAFADAGWQVRAQARKDLPAALHGRVQAVRCDAFDAAALAAAAQGADVVVHALNPPYTEWARQALPLADAAMASAQAGGALLMLPGNVYNYGSDLPPRLAPDTPEHGDHAKARIRIEVEARIAAAPGALEQRAADLRLQRAHLPAQRRLAAAQLLRGAAERAGLGHREEGAQQRPVGFGGIHA